MFGIRLSTALAIAGFSAIFHEKKTLIIDADLTGTSLADIPSLHIGEKTKGKIHYFNELLLAKPREFGEFTPITSKDKGKKIEQFYHEATFEDGLTITCMPSSPCFEDIKRVIPLISQEDHLQFFQHRLEDILVTSIRDGFQVIIVDYPPGLFGISKASLNTILNRTRLDKLFRAVSTNKNEGIIAKALLIATLDHVDYMALVPSFFWFLKENGLWKEEEKESDEQKSSKKNDFYSKIDLIFNKGEKIAKDHAFEFNDILNNLKKLPDDRKVDDKFIESLGKRAKESIEINFVNSEGEGENQISIKAPDKLRKDLTKTFGKLACLKFDKNDRNNQFSIFDYCITIAS